MIVGVVGDDNMYCLNFVSTTVKTSLSTSDITHGTKLHDGGHKVAVVHHLGLIDTVVWYYFFRFLIWCAWYARTAYYLALINKLLLIKEKDIVSDTTLHHDYTSVCPLLSDVFFFRFLMRCA